MSKATELKAYRMGYLDALSICLERITDELPVGEIEAAALRQLLMITEMPNEKPKAIRRKRRAGNKPVQAVREAVSAGANTP